MWKMWSSRNSWTSIFRLWWICIQDRGKPSIHCPRNKVKPKSNKLNTRKHHLHEKNPTLNVLGEWTTVRDHPRSQTTNLFIWKQWETNLWSHQEECSSQKMHGPNKKIQRSKLKRHQLLRKTNWSKRQKSLNKWKLHCVYTKK